MREINSFKSDDAEFVSKSLYLLSKSRKFSSKSGENENVYCDI